MRAFYRFEVFGILHETPAIHIAMKSLCPLEGLLSHLSRKYGGNVHDTGIVKITSSSTKGDDPQYAAIFREESR
jgi:hypothetical protein